MGTENLSNEEIVEYYRKDLTALLKYLPWLESKLGQETSSVYRGNGINENSIPFPVYEGTLLAFVKEAEKTCFMDRNHIYVYRRSRLNNSMDELRLIQQATIRDFDKMAGILSHYILGGRRKAVLWSEGARNGVYVNILKKSKELIEFWDGQKV